MRHTFPSFVLLVCVLAGCADQQATFETSEKINETRNAIEDNMETLDSLALQAETPSGTANDGPMPADAYSLNKTGKFIYLAAYGNGREKTWMLLKAKSAEQIEAKYPEFDVYADRPDGMSDEQKQQLFSDCLKKDHVWDLGDPPTGWLKDFERKNR